MSPESSRNSEKGLEIRSEEERGSEKRGQLPEKGGQDPRKGGDSSLTTGKPSALLAEFLPCLCPRYHEQEPRENLHSLSTPRGGQEEATGQEPR